MEWLAGAFVGGLIGLGSALIATEYTAWRDRSRRVKHMARSLRSEISLSKPVIEEVERGLSEAIAQDRAGTTLIRPLSRDAFNAWAGDLGLLRRGPREAVYRFYNNLAGIESIVREAWLLYTRYPPSFKQPPREALRPFHAWLKEGTIATLAAADDAVTALDKIAV